MSSTAEDLLAAVEQSPRAAAAHDRAGWVSLFTDDGCVEDPVGSGSHVGHVQLGRFYDTFIGPRHITFHRDLDIVTGTSVICDLTLEVMMGHGVRLLVPTFIRYDLREGENGWQIARLRAYWELAAMIGAFLGNGVKTLPTSLQLSGALLRNQGLPGAARYMSGLTGPARRGKRVVEQALAGGLLTDQPRECEWSKVIAAGSTVAASITAPSGRGVLLADLDHRGREIKDVSIFRNEK